MATYPMTASHNSSLLGLTVNDIVQTKGFVLTLNQNEVAGTLTNATGGTIVLSASNVVRTLQACLIGGTNSHDTLLVSGSPTTLTLTALGIKAVSGKAINVTGAGSTIVVNGTGGMNTGGSASSACVLVAGANNLIVTINGTLTSGSGGSYANGAVGIYYGATGGVITVNGDILAGPGAPGMYVAGTGAGTLTINGNVQGGPAGSSPGLYLTAASAIACTITGSAVGGAVTNCFGVDAQSTGGSLVIGKAIGNGYGGAVGTNSASVGLNAIAGVNAVQGAVVKIYAVQQGPLGMPPVVGPYTLLVQPTMNTSTHINSATGATVQLVDTTASLTLSAADIRLGTVIGGITGTLAVPAASQVSWGVAVGNTTGTAILTVQNAKDALAQALPSF